MRVPHRLYLFSLFSLLSQDLYVLLQLDVLITRQQHIINATQEVAGLDTTEALVVFSLPNTILSELRLTANREGISQAQVISILVHLYYLSGNVDKIDDWFDIARGQEKQNQNNYQ